MNFWFASVVIFAHLSRAYRIGDMKEAIRKDDVETVQEFLYDRFRNHVLKEMLMDRENDGQSNDSIGDPLILLDWSLRYAVTSRAPEVVRLLLQVYDVDVNAAVDKIGQNPLHLVAQEPYYYFDSSIVGRSVALKSKLEKVADTLLECNPDVHLRDDFSYTPLMWAVCFNYVSLVEKLTARGSSINERNLINGETPLNMAVRYRCLEMTEFLLEKGAEAKVNYDGENALHIIFNTLSALPRFIHNEKGNSAIMKQLLRSGGAEEMLQQKRNRDQKTPVDIFFGQSELDRDILVDLLKILPNLDDKYALTALRIFHPSLEEDSSIWPADNYLGYVKFAFNKYLEVLDEENLKKISYLEGFFGELRKLKSKNVDEIPAKSDVERFVESDVYSLYVILKTLYQMLKQNRKEAAEDVEEFEECLRHQSALFQNSLWNSIAEGTALEILPTHILRLSKIMALVQLTRGWSVEEMTDAAPKLLN